LRYLWLILLLLNLCSTNSFSAESNINAGTIIQVRTLQSINDQEYKTGDYFKVTIVDNIKNDQEIAIKSGSLATAMINKIQSPGKGQQTPRFILTLVSLSTNNHLMNISTLPITEEGTPQNITTSASLSKGYTINLAEGTILNFTLKESISL